MFAKIKKIVISFFRPKQLPSTMIASNLPMQTADSVQKLLRDADERGLLNPSLFGRIKRFFRSLLK